MLILKGCIAIAVIVAAAVLLWVRSTPDATLGVDTFGSAVVEVVLFGGPSFAAYLALGWTRSAVVVEGAVLGAVIVPPFWTAADDRHSTASLGPALAGWMLGPVVLLTLTIVRVFVRHRR